MVQHRLPLVNQDDGTWGDILRQFIAREHFNDDTDNVADYGRHKTVTIMPGTTSAGTAPLKFTSGPLMTAPEAGAVEFNNDHLYITQTSSTTRKKIAAYDDTGSATGDIYYRNSSGYFTKLPVGSSGDILNVSGGIPAWTGTIDQSKVTNLATDLGNKLDANVFNNRMIAGANLVIDPAFEDTTIYRDFGSWDNAGNASIAGNVTYSTEQAHGGTHSLKMIIDGSGNEQWLFLMPTAVDTGNHSNEDNSTAIRVQPGQKFYLEIWIKAKAGNTTGTGTAQLAIQFKDSLGVNAPKYVNAATLTPAPSPGSWIKMAGTVIVPSGYDIGWPFVDISYYDNMPSGAGNSFYFDDARVVDITETTAILNQRMSAGANMVISPDFEDISVYRESYVYPKFDGTLDLEASGSYSTEQSHSGTHSYKMTLPNQFDSGASYGGAWALLMPNVEYTNNETDTTKAIHVQPGQKYYMEAWVYSKTGNSATADDKVSIYYSLQDSKGVNSKTSGVFQEVASITTGSWQKLSGYMTVPVGYDSLYTEIQMFNNAGASTNVYYVDDVRVVDVSDTVPNNVFTQRMLAGNNLVIGPDFEDTSIDRAYGNWPNSSVASISYSTEQAHGGTHSLKMLVPRGLDGATWVTDTWCYVMPYPSDANYQYDDLATHPDKQMKVQPGQKFYMEAWVYPHTSNTLSTDEAVTITSRFADSKGINSVVYDEQLVSSSTLTAGQWNKISGTAVVPAGYDLALFQIEAYNYNGTAPATDNIYYWDDIVVRDATDLGVSNAKARSGSNIVIDPHFDDSSILRYTWTTGSDYSTDFAHSGSQSWKLHVIDGDNDPVFLAPSSTDGSNDEQRFFVTENDVYYLEVWAYAPAANTTTGGLTLGATAFKSSDWSSSGLTAHSMTAAAMGKGSWVKFSTTVTVPAGYDRMEVYFRADSSNTVGNNYYIDDAVVSDVTNVANRTVTMTNKTISGASNTLTNIALSSLSSSGLNTLSSSLRANRNLNGGGTLTVDGSGYVSWSSRFLVIANGRGSNFATAGYFDINCPTSGTITGVGGASNKTATAAGIPISNWEALYYILPIGSSSTSLSANFRVVTYTSDVDIPHDWLLICVRNGDSNVVTFNNGITLSPGQSMSTAATFATLTGTETLTNKTLTSPKINAIKDATNGVTAMSFGSDAGADRNINIYASTGSPGIYSESSVTNTSMNLGPKGNGSVNIWMGSGQSTAILQGAGADTNVDLDLRSQGTGVVKANGNRVITANEVSGYSKLVCTTQYGDTGTEDGADTWAKIATFSTGTNQFVTCTLILSVAVASNWSLDPAIVSVLFRSNATSQNPTVDVSIMALGGNSVHIDPDSFKVISGGWSTDMELWVRKGDDWGHFNFYETANNISGTGTLTYNNNAAWQSTVPSGAVNNVSSNGVTAYGHPVAKKYAATIGDGSTTAITVTHNLGTQDCTYSIRDASTNTVVDCDVTFGSTSQATFTFDTAPASNAYKIVIIG